MASGEAGTKAAGAPKAAAVPRGVDPEAMQGPDEAPGTRPGGTPGAGGKPAFGQGPGLGAVLRRKAAGGRPPAVASGEAPAARALRRALARAAQADCHLPLAASEVRLREASLAELLEMPEDMALLAVLEGPGERLGLMALGPAVVTALIEQHTTGSVGAAEGPPRRPTRTDAAMAAGLIDRAMTEFETGLAAETGAAATAAAWASGYRYASFLDEPRPLGLLLEDIAYEVATATVDLAGGARRGTVLLALPAGASRSAPGRARPAAADRKGPVGPVRPAAVDADIDGDAAAAWQDRMSRTVMASPASLGAVLCRLKLPLGVVLGWQRGDFVVLPGGMLDRVTLEGPGARVLARARLGQSRGARALRLTPAEAEGAGGHVAPPAALSGQPAVASVPSASAPLPDLGSPALAPLPDLGDDLLDI